MKQAPKRLISLLGTSLILWHFPATVSADATGWDCTKAADGSWLCNTGVVTPAAPAAVPESATRLPEGPVTPPAESLPPRETVQTQPEAEPVPVEPEIAKPEPEPTPEPAAAKPVIAKPESEPTPEPVAAEPVIAKPEPEPAPEPAVAEPVIAEPEPAPEPAVAEPVIAEPEPAPEPAVAEPVVAKPEPAPEPAVAEPVVAKPEPAPTPVRPVAIKQLTDGDDPWALCPPVDRPAQVNLSGVDRATAEIKLSADNADLVRDGISTFRGNVEITRADERLLADAVDYNRDKELASAKGNVFLADNTIGIKGEELQLNLKEDKTTISKAQFDLYSRHGRGEAETLRRNGIKNTTRLKNTTYTTCPVGNSDWQLNAEKIKLDHNEGVGTAKNASINFKGIPFFYTPFMTFPLDDRRKSGFLTPSFGNSDESGTEFSIPYYWNIAPNRDATITPRIFEERGLQLGGEYRYLSKISEGTLSAEYLASDNEFNDEDRYLFSYQNTSAFTPRFRVNADINYVSDSDYFEDLGNNIVLSSITHLERRLDARYSGDFWNLSGRLQGYKTLDDTIASDDRPYERLPQVLFNANLPDQHFGLDYGLQAEATYFDRDNSVTGTRFDILPSVSLPLRNSYGFVTPKIGLRYTKYDLDNTLAGNEDSPDRSVPIYSVDSGLYFDRQTSFAGRAITQTLEPRFFYLNVPERSQDDLIVDERGQSIVFDTDLFDFSFDQLFRDNRFTGADRVGDANQLTAALSTRFIDQASGIERASASIGQIYYFDDRKVTLPGEATETDSSSEIVAEVSARFTRSLSARAGVQWDPHENQTEKGVAAVRYQSDNDHIINLAYRNRRSLLEQTDFSVNWPINHQWSAVGRWNYALDENRTIAAFAGLEYESCCWVMRVVGREFINDPDQEDKNFALLLQLELKGLTSFGDNVKKFLGRGILGYDREPLNDDDVF